MNESLLELSDLSLRRGNFCLDQVSLQVLSEEIFAIIGKSGAGKTMLLESIAGFHRIESGKILFKGKDMSLLPLHKRKVGYLYQEYCLFPHMNARENISYGLRWKKITKKEQQKRIEEIAQELEIEYILEQYPGTLSGGEQQRVALARALVTEPELLLLDEPFSALDLVTKQKMYGLVKNIHEKHHCAIIFVTHDFQEAQLFADRIGVLLHGHLHGVVESNQLFCSDWDADVRSFLGKEEIKK